MSEFVDVVNTVCEALAREQRISYRMLKRRFALSDDDLEDLRSELIDAKRLARDEDGKVLVWDSRESIEPVPHVLTPVSYTPGHLADRIRSEQQAMEASGSDGERKTITALFADLKGSTALLGDLDPEDAQAIIDPALQIMMNAVHRYEGYVAQALGDGILALFGAPLAHEDHAQRAVYAALAMQESLQQYAATVQLKHGVPLAMRVGINTGEVVVRSIRKDDLHTDYVPIGHSINLASRLEQMAAPGSILVTQTTARLVDGFFAFKSLGTADVRGVSTPVPVLEVTGLGESRTRLQVAVRRGLTGFVGRQREISLLEQALTRTGAGRGQVIGIMGEPGLGKSRLVHEIKARASGFDIVEAYSAAHSKGAPYLPIVEMLKSYFRIDQHDDDRTRRDKIIGRLLGLDRALDDVLPYLLALLNIPVAESPLREMDPQLRRRRTLDALVKALLRASQEQPLLLIFEDLHWIDTETQGFLDALVERIADFPLLLLTNYRPEYRHDWGSKPHFIQLRLAPFGRPEAVEFLDKLLGASQLHSPAAPLAALRNWVMDKTEGTPFFIEEVVQELFERQIVLRDRAGQLQFPNGTFVAPQVPATVQGVIAARIDRLAPGEKSILQQLAVIGREFPYARARDVTGLPDDTLLALINALQRKEFLFELPAFPDRAYSFKHALTQEVAYHSLLLETRRHIHERTARAIEQSHESALEAHFGDLAHHYSRGTSHDKALSYLEKAGLQAAQRAASHEATTYLQTALERLRSLPDASARSEDELRLLLGLSGPLRAVRGMTSAEIEALCERTLTLSKQAGTVEDSMRVQAELRILHSMRGRAELALTHAQALLDLASSAESRIFLSHGHSSMTVAHYTLGNLQACRKHAEQTAGCYDSTTWQLHANRFGYDPLMLVQVFGALALVLLGHPDQAQRVMRDETARVERLAVPYYQGFIGSTCACLLAILRRYDECRAVAEATAEWFAEFPEWNAWSMIWRGYSIASTDPATGVVIVERGRGLLLDAGSEFCMTHFNAVTAECNLWAGNQRRARALLEDGLAMAAGNGERAFLAELHRLLGELTLTEDHPANKTKAEQYFERAIGIARAQQARWWELRSTLSLARLLTAQGRTAEARARLETVTDWFDDGLDHPELVASRQLLEELQPP